MYIPSLIQVFDIYLLICAALQARGTLCVLTVQTHTGLHQPLSKHGGLYSTTAPTATTNVNLFCGIHRTQWGRATNTGTQPQLSTSLFQVHHHSCLRHLTRESILSFGGGP